MARTRRQRLAARLAVVAVWTVVLLVGFAPSARAVGLPFVDLPTAGSVASDAIDSLSRAIVNLIASSVAALTNEIIKVSDTVGAPQVGPNNTWFTASYKRTMSVSLYLMAIAALVAVTAAGIRGKVGDMLSVLLVGVPGSIVAMMLATLGVQLALALTDAMTAYTFRSSVGDIQSFLHDIGTTFTATDGAAQPTAQLAPGLTLIIGLLLILAQLVILAVLIIRSALIYIVTLFLPLVFAMQVWPATRHMVRKALELLAVLILSKFAIFTCFALGASAMSNVLKPATGGGPPAVQSAIVGFGVMAAAAFSPMLLMSIVPGIAGSFGGGMPGGTAGAGALGVRTPSQIMRSTLASVHTVRGGSQSGSRSSGSSGGKDSSTTNRAPTPPGGSGGGRSGGAGGRAEQAHSAANVHPASAVAAQGAKTLAQGAAAPARSVTSQVASSSTPHDANDPAGSSRADSGPHVVNGRSGSGPGASSSSAPSDRSRAERSAPPSGADAPASAPSERSDGFSTVHTRKPFTLETT